MIVIVVANQKGGVGKTATAVSVAAVLAERSLRVLVIDLDQQAQCSTCVNVPPKKGTRSAACRLLHGEAPLLEVVVRTDFGFDLVAGAKDLRLAEKHLGTVTGADFVLREALEHAAESYDYVVIDTPPAAGALSSNALTAADWVLVPVQYEAPTLEGYGELLSTIELVVRRTNPKLRLGAVLATKNMVRSAHSAAVSDWLGANVPELLATRVGFSTAFPDAYDKRKPITVFQPKGKSAAAYRAVVAELDEKGLL